MSGTKKSKAQTVVLDMRVLGFLFAGVLFAIWLAAKHATFWGGVLSFGVWLAGGILLHYLIKAQRKDASAEADAEAEAGAEAN